MSFAWLTAIAYRVVIVRYLALSKPYLALRPTKNRK
jgi:hypothetical protein